MRNNGVSYTYVTRKYMKEVKGMTYITNKDAIKKAMIDNGIKTVTELSVVSGVNRNTLGKILNGDTQPSSAVMYKLVDCLKISPEEAGSIFFSNNLRNA